VFHDVKAGIEQYGAPGSAATFTFAYRFASPTAFFDHEPVLT
jgi:hypothetical protein